MIKIIKIIGILFAVVVTGILVLTFFEWISQVIPHSILGHNITFYTFYEVLLDNLEGFKQFGKLKLY
jgi:hypothetical protein